MKKTIREKYRESLSGNYATLMIIAINIVIFIVLNTIPNIETELLIYPNLILKKPWTLVTVFFSHLIHVHLLVNMALLLIFGIKLEKLTSSKVVLLIYIISGFIGSLSIIPVSVVLDWTKDVAGASAAVFGVVAAFSVMQPNAIVLKSKAKTWLMSLFVSNIVIAILNPSISIGAGAHVAGIIVGMVYGYCLKRRSR